jgi:hypothetical protein
VFPFIIIGNQSVEPVELSSATLYTMASGHNQAKQQRINGVDKVHTPYGITNIVLKELEAPWLQSTRPVMMSRFLQDYDHYVKVLRARGQQQGFIPEIKLLILPEVAEVIYSTYNLEEGTVTSAEIRTAMREAIKKAGLAKGNDVDVLFEKITYDMENPDVELRVHGLFAHLKRTAKENGCLHLLKSEELFQTIRTRLINSLGMEEIKRLVVEELQKLEKNPRELDELIPPFLKGVQRGEVFLIEKRNQEKIKNNNKWFSPNYQNKKQTNYEKGESTVSKSWTQNTPICSKCGKEGHYRRDCNFQNNEMINSGQSSRKRAENSLGSRDLENDSGKRC